MDIFTHIQEDTSFRFVFFEVQLTLYQFQVYNLYLLCFNTCTYCEMITTISLVNEFFSYDENF